MRLDSNVAGGVIGQQSLEADAEKENRTHKVERPLAILKKKCIPVLWEFWRITRLLGRMGMSSPSLPSPIITVFIIY